MIWIIKVIKICLERLLLVKYYTIQHYTSKSLWSNGLYFFMKNVVVALGDCAIKGQVIPSQQLADRLHKPTNFG